MNDRLTSRLLAGRDRLSRVEKDQILAGVLPAQASRARWFWLAVPALAAIVLVVIAPWKTADEFTARGGTQPIATLHVSCATGCAQGSKLLFDLHGTTSYRYFAAFARRADGTVLWYFPSTDTATSEPISTTGVLDRGIVLGAEHPAGAYRIYGVFSSTPLTRGAIRDAFDPAKLTAGSGTTVVPSDIEVR